MIPYDFQLPVQGSQCAARGAVSPCGDVVGVDRLPEGREFRSACRRTGLSLCFLYDSILSVVRTARTCPAALNLCDWLTVGENVLDDRARRQSPRWEKKFSRAGHG
jgi:hypothetical protein